jgi:hypothetical protein
LDKAGYNTPLTPAAAFTGRLKAIREAGYIDLL